MTEDGHINNLTALYWTNACEEFMQRLTAYALRLANGRSYDADDLVQDTVLHAIQCSKDPEEVKNPLGYLLRMMRNIWITKWHKEGTANVESLDELQNTKALKNHPAVAPEVFRILENEELAKAMRVVLRNLAPRETSLLKLYFKGYKCNEIASILNEDVRLTRTDLNAVRTKVQQRIKRIIKQPKDNMR